jgi:hypothetical protein
MSFAQPQTVRTPKNKPRHVIAFTTCSKKETLLKARIDAFDFLFFGDGRRCFSIRPYFFVGHGGYASAGGVHHSFCSVLPKKNDSGAIKAAAIGITLSATLDGSYPGVGGE